MNWHGIADILASRLVHHAYCPENESLAEGLERGCPYCRDIAAVEMYQRAGGTVSLGTFGNERLSTPEIVRQFEAGEING